MDFSSLPFHLASGSASLSRVIRYLPFFLLLLLTSCREGNTTTQAETPEAPEKKETTQTNLDPAKVSIRPFGSLDRITSRFPAGPGVINYFGEHKTPGGIPTVFSDEIKPGDKVIHLGSEYTPSSQRSPYLLDPDGAIIYHYPSSKLYVYGNVDFTEEAQQAYNTYLKTAPSYVRTKATLYRIPHQKEAPLVWPTPTGEQAVKLQEFDLSSRNGEKSEITWGEAEDPASIIIDATHHRENPWTAYTHIDAYFPHYQCSLGTDLNLNLNQDTTLELKRTESEHLLLTLHPSIYLADGTKLENHNIPDSPEKYTQLAPSSRQGYYLTSYWVQPDFLKLLVPQRPHENKEDYSDDPFADNPTDYTERDDTASGIGINGAEEYVARIQIPELGNYFSPGDAVYDLSRIFAANGVKSNGYAYVLYNQSKQHLHLFAERSIHDLLEGLLLDIRFDPPTSLLSHIQVTVEDKQTEKITSLLEGTIYHRHGTKFDFSNGCNQLFLECTCGEDGQSLEIYSSELITGSIKIKQSGSIISTLNKESRHLLYQEGDKSYYLAITSKRIYPDLTEKFPELMVELTKHEEIIEADLRTPELFTRAHQISSNDIPISLYYDSESDPFLEGRASIKDDGKQHILSPYPYTQAPDIIGISSRFDQCIDVQKLLEKSGVVFPEGSWCILNLTRSTVIAHTDALNQDIIEQLCNDLGPNPPKMIKYTFLQVSIPQQDAENDTPLDAESILSNHSIVYHYSASSIMRSGEKSTYDTPSVDRVSTGEFAVELTIREDGSTIDCRASLNSSSLKLNLLNTCHDGVPQVSRLPNQENDGQVHFTIIRADIIRP